MEGSEPDHFVGVAIISFPPLERIVFPNNIIRILIIIK